jgi:NAD(P)H-dependent FMN reductase
MKYIFLNGSPRKSGTVAQLLMAVREEIDVNRHEWEWIDVYDLQMKQCGGCMKCRSTDTCILPEDDGHKVGRKIKNADGVIIGTPTHWGNMSTPLKLLFDRNVPVFIGEKSSGMPVPRQKGKPAVVVTACTTPWPFNFILPESRGAVKAVREVLKYGGYSYLGKIVKPGTKMDSSISLSLQNKARRIGMKLNRM